MRKNRLSIKHVEALKHIRNRIVHQGTPPSVRELQAVLRYRSPRSAAQILEQLAGLGYVKRGKDGRLQLLRELPEDSTHARTVNVPLVGIVPCGAPLLAEENVEAVIPVSSRLARPPHRYFLLRAAGDSMDLAGVEDGDLLLVRQQPHAEDGDRVVALIDDEATVKEFHRSADTISLEPRSRNKSHKPIILTTDFQVQGIVVATIPDRREA